MVSLVQGTYIPTNRQYEENHPTKRSQTGKARAFKAHELTSIAMRIPRSGVWEAIIGGVLVTGGPKLDCRIIMTGVHLGRSTRELTRDRSKERGSKWCWRWLQIDLEVIDTPPGGAAEWPRGGVGLPLSPSSDWMIYVTRNVFITQTILSISLQERALICAL